MATAQKNYQQAAFSYLELLIIISILALLAAIIIPNLITSKNITQQENTSQQIKHNLNQVKLSLEEFRFNFGYYPVYNFPLAQQKKPELGTLKDIITYYPQLTKITALPNLDYNKYYYYAPASIDFSTATPFDPKLKQLQENPLQGANHFIIVYNGNDNYYKLTSYSSDVVIKAKKNNSTANNKLIISLFEL
ncbi:MAG: hypothetical protein ACQERJ_07825 [Bacillota bacterium]